MAPGVAHALLQRECRGPHRSAVHDASSQYLNRQPMLWQEQEITGKLARTLGTQVDKAFAVAWQDEHRLLVGTKSNHLLQWDTAAGSLRAVDLPPAPPRQHGMAVMETVWGSCGIHSMAVNPAGDMVATGGAQPADCAVLSLPDFRPVQTLVGHRDWVFGCAWVSDRHVVTGSRDQSVALWTVPEADSGAPEAQYKAAEGPGGLQRKFEGKVRAVQHDFHSGRLAALSTDGCVKLLDPARDLRTTRTVKLQHVKELVCMEQRADMLAVGSVGHVTLLDPRRRTAELTAVASPDENQGVRSVQLTQHLLSFGTGRGKLFFYDLRARAFLPTEPTPHALHDPCGGGDPPCSKLAPALPPAWRPRRHLELGPGHVERNELYFDHFSGSDIRHACYAHAWDASRSRLFVCGGPLAFGLKGLYLGVWH